MSKEHASALLTCPGVIDDFCIHDHQHLEPDIVKEFDRDGFWTKFVVKEVALDKIAYKSWIAERQVDTIERLRSTGKTKPIKLGRIDKKSHKFLMVDGNHRSSACVELGYKSIPAIVEEKIKSPPFPEDEMEKWRFYNEMSAWLFEWKYQMKNLQFTLVVNAISSEEVEANFYAKNDPLIAYISKTPTGMLYTLSSLQFESDDEQLFLDKVGSYLIVCVTLSATSSPYRRNVREPKIFDNNFAKYYLGE